MPNGQELFAGSFRASGSARARHYSDRARRWRVPTPFNSEHAELAMAGKAPPPFDRSVVQCGIDWHRAFPPFVAKLEGR